MGEDIYSFTSGRGEILEYTVNTEDGKAVIELNGGDLGRLPVENVETVRELEEALERLEEHFLELERRKEEL